MKKWFEKVKEWIDKVITWMGYDGVLHLLCSALIVLFFAGMFPWWVAALIGLAAGIGKEIYDALHPDSHSADAHDLVCDLLGIVAALAGVGVWAIYHLIF